MMAEPTAPEPQCPWDRSEAEVLAQPCPKHGGPLGECPLPLTRVIHPRPLTGPLGALLLVLALVAPAWAVPLVFQTDTTDPWILSVPPVDPLPELFGGVSYFVLRQPLYTLNDRHIFGRLSLGRVAGSQVDSLTVSSNLIAEGCCLDLILGALVAPPSVASCVDGRCDYVMHAQAMVRHLHPELERLAGVPWVPDGFVPLSLEIHQTLGTGGIAGLTRTRVDLRLYDEAPVATPEPATLILIGMSAAGLGAWARRRRGR